MDIMENEINKSFEVKRKGKRGPKRKYVEPRRSLHLVLPEMLIDTCDELAEKCGCTRTEIIHTALLQVDRTLAENTQKTFQMMRQSIEIYKNQAKDFQNQTQELNEILKKLSGNIYGFCDVIPNIEGLDSILASYEVRYRKAIKDMSPIAILDKRKIFSEVIYDELETKYIREGKAFKPSFSKLVEKAILKKLIEFEETVPREG